MNKIPQKTQVPAEVDQAARELLVAVDWADAEARADAVARATKAVDWAAKALAEAVSRVATRYQEDVAMDWAERTLGEPEVRAADAGSREGEWEVTAWEVAFWAKEAAVWAADADSQAALAEEAGEAWVREAVARVAKMVAKSTATVAKAAAARPEAADQGNAVAWAAAWAEVAEKAQMAKARATWADMAAMDWSKALVVMVAKSRKGEYWVRDALKAKFARVAVEYRMNEAANAGNEVVKAVDEVAAYYLQEQ